MQLAAFLAEVGIYRPADVDLAHLKAFYEALVHRGVSASTRRRKVFALKTFFHALKTAKIIDYNPAVGLLPDPHPVRAIRALSIQERRALLGACASSIRGRAVIELLLATGITLSEVTRLNVTDVDVYRYQGRLFVRRPERYKQRELPLDYEVCHALDIWLKTRPDSDDLALFVGRFKKGIGERTVQRIVKRCLTKAGIENASVSSLRHTYAVHQLLQGVTLPTLKERLGLAHRGDVLLYMPVVEAMSRRIE
jgi:site-specific recombinase XerD